MSALVSPKKPPGETQPHGSCPLIPWMTRPYHNSRVLLFLFIHRWSWTGEPSESHRLVNFPVVAQSGPKWPKMAQNGPVLASRFTLFLFGQRPIFWPQGCHLTCFPDTKRPKMAQNGLKIRKSLFAGYGRRQRPAQWIASPGSGPAKLPSCRSAPMFRNRVSGNWNGRGRPAWPLLCQTPSRLNRNAARPGRLSEMCMDKSGIFH